MRGTLESDRCRVKYRRGGYGPLSGPRAPKLMNHTRARFTMLGALEVTAQLIVYTMTRCTGAPIVMRSGT
jgi:hypothetical protein